MTSNYQKIIAQNLMEIYRDRAHDLEHLLPAVKEGETFHFKAFGEECALGPEGIFFSVGTP